MHREFRKSRLRHAVPAYAAGDAPPAGAAMTQHEIEQWLGDLLDGLPVTLQLTRLCLTVVALVESGGAPAADCLRAIVAVRGQDRPGAAWEDGDAAEQDAEQP